MILCRYRKTKALFRLCGCAGWSATFLFTCSEVRFSRGVAHFMVRHIYQRYQVSFWPEKASPSCTSTLSVSKLSECARSPEPSLAAAMAISRVVGHIVWCLLTANNDYIHKWLSLKRDMLNNTANTLNITENNTSWISLFTYSTLFFFVSIF